jgi:hypothetical protein
MTLKTVAMSDRSEKQIKVQLVIGAMFLLMFAPLLIKLATAITVSPQPPENRVFGLFVFLFVTSLVLLVAWKWFLLAIHVKHAKVLEGEVVLRRILAPEVHVSSVSELKSFASATPAMDAPYFKRGTVFHSGTLLFYISDYLQDASALLDRFSRDQRS